MARALGPLPDLLEAAATEMFPVPERRGADTRQAVPGTVSECVGERTMRTTLRAFSSCSFRLTTNRLRPAHGDGVLQQGFRWLGLKDVVAIFTWSWERKSGRTSRVAGKTLPHRGQSEAAKSSSLVDKKSSRANSMLTLSRCR